MVEIADSIVAVNCLGLANEKLGCFSKIIRDSELNCQDDDYQDEKGHA
ncbi:hypothetical protein TUM4641_20070 [Shewanella morhuae]|nr:hypothetical protein TUM4641_20070 [Shewanella morhuae]